MDRFDEKVGNYLAGTHIPLSPIGKTLLEIIKREQGGSEEKFLKPLGISQVAFAAHLAVPVQRINELVRGKRGITPETAWLLSQAFNTTPEFWLNLQMTFDLSRNRPGRQVHAIRSVES